MKNTSTNHVIDYTLSLGHLNAKPDSRKYTCTCTLCGKDYQHNPTGDTFNLWYCGECQAKYGNCGNG